MSTPNPTPNAPSAYCRQCGKPLREEERRDVRGMIFCEDCLTAVVAGNLRTPPPPAPVGYSMAPQPASPLLAAFLGFIPGVGAMYNGQFAKGFAHVIIAATLIALAGHNEIAGIFCGLLIAAFWAYMVIDAYQTARARRFGLPLPDPFGLNNLFSGSGSGFATGVPVGAGSVPPQSPYTEPAPFPPSCRPAADRQPIGAFILIVLGVFFLLSNFHPLHEFISRLFWPLFLIGLGVWLAMKRLDLTHRYNSEPKNGDETTTEIDKTAL